MSTCRECGAEFAPRSSGGKPQVYCTARCRLDHHNRKRTKTTSTLPPNPKGGREAVCENCGETYTTRKRAGGRRQRYCSDKCMYQGWNARNPEASRRHALAKYGMTLEDYNAQLQRQGGVCAICGEKPKNNLLAVDHDHDTGAVRGLLCSPCNRHVGYFERHGAAVQAYLEQPPYPTGFNHADSRARVDTEGA